MSRAHQRDVVIIGGGVMGGSAAYHLARAGVTKVTLLEAGQLAGGSSGKPLGGVRAQFSDRANIALGLRSLRAFQRFEHELGVDIGLQQVGYLFAVRDPADLRAFEQSVTLQNELGVPSRMISAAAAVRTCPYLDAAQLVGAAWCADAGFARPVDVVTGYATAAAALGVEIRTRSEVTDLAVDGVGRAVISTADGERFEAEAVVCTAGAWSGEIAAQVGVDLPITPIRREVGFSAPLVGRPARLPFTIDYSTTAYFHGAENGGLLFGWADPEQPAGFDTEVSTGWHEPLRDALSAFAPTLAQTPIVSGWAGLYEVTPDYNAVIGEAAAGVRFLYAAGFSGHGFLQGPAVGECIADLYLGREPAVDIACFDAARFERPVVRTELGII